MKLISIEGIDGSGKTTLVNSLEAMGYQIFKEIPKDLSEVDAGSLGYSIRELLQVNESDSDEFRVMLANKYVNLRLQYQGVITEKLQKGDLIIDRGILSTLVYGYTGNEEENNLLAKENFRTKLPDLTIYLDLDIDLSLSRLNSRSDSRQEAYKAKDVMLKNYTTYSVLIEKYRKVLNIKTIDASQSRNRVLEMALSLIGE